MRFFRAITCALFVLTASAVMTLHAQTDVVVQTNPATEQESAAPYRKPTSTIAEVTSTSSTEPVRESHYLTTETTDRPSIEINAGDPVSTVPKRFQYAFRLNMRGVYDDNIFLTNRIRVDDVYFAFEPGITIGFGDIVGHDQNSIRLDYAPSFFLYADHSEENAVQHIIHLDGQYRMGHLSLSLSQGVELLDGTNHATTDFSSANSSPTLNLDTGGNTKVDIYSTNANFSYDLTGKTFLSGGLQFSANEYENNLISSQQLSGNLFINYIYSPKLTAGLGGTFGYNWVEGNNPDQSFEQANLHTTYELSGKVNLDASVGLEFRQFENDARGGTYVSPVYELGLTYQPFDGTSVNLRGSRHIQNSAVFAGQNYTTSDFTLGIRQRFLRRMYIGVVGGYERTDYFNTVQNVSATRNDDYFFVQPSIDVTITRYWTAGVYYLHRKNDSSIPVFSFYDNQVGLRTSLTF